MTTIHHLSDSLQNYERVTVAHGRLRLLIADKADREALVAAMRRHAACSPGTFIGILEWAVELLLAGHDWRDCVEWITGERPTNNDERDWDVGGEG